MNCWTYLIFAGGSYSAILPGLTSLVLLPGQRLTALADYRARNKLLCAEVLASNWWFASALASSSRLGVTSQVKNSAFAEVFTWWLLPDSNWGHKALQASALPTELKSLVQAYTLISFALPGKASIQSYTSPLKAPFSRSAPWIGPLYIRQD